MGAETERDVVDVPREYLLAVRGGEDTTRHVTDWPTSTSRPSPRCRTGVRPRSPSGSTSTTRPPQDVLTSDPEHYESRWQFFGANVVTVAGEPLSLDDVEHGVLRGSRAKYGFGSLPRLASSRFQRRVGLETVDPRIHFAFNCGAESCPASRAYDVAEIDVQLATAAYLDRTVESVEYDPDEGVVRVPRVCLWFYRDVGRKPGVRRLLREHDVVPPERTPRLRFQRFDWSFDPGRFAAD